MSRSRQGGVGVVWPLMGELPCAEVDVGWSVGVHRGRHQRDAVLRGGGYGGGVAVVEGVKPA